MNEDKFYDTIKEAEKYCYIETKAIFCNLSSLRER